MKSITTLTVLKRLVKEIQSELSKLSNPSQRRLVEIDFEKGTFNFTGQNDKEIHKFLID